MGSTIQLKKWVHTKSKAKTILLNVYTCIYLEQIFDQVCLCVSVWCDAASSYM